MKISKRRIPALFGLLLTLGFLFAAAACAGATHTLRFFDGGTEIAVVESPEGSEYTAPEAPAREGLVFEGWSTEENGDLVALPDTMPKEDVTYHAQWSALLTLDAGEGGTISKTEHRVRVGASLSSLLKENEPKPLSEGVTFAGWFQGNSLFDETAVMPKGPLQLTAKYTAEYTLALYRQNADGSYPEEPERSTERGFLGERIQYVCEEEHFTVDPAHEGGSIPSLSAGQTLTVYLCRNTYTVRFSDNLPAGTVSSPLPSAAALYGGSVQTADAAQYALSEAYRFAGWSTAQDGDPEYAADETIEVSRNMTLYACWDVAYTDRFGGEDLIFLLKWEEGKALLLRGSLPEKVGSYEGSDFSFPEAGLKGRVSEAGHFFAYFREASAKKYTLYDVFQEELGTATLTLDGAFGATYTYQYGGSSVTVSGTYVLDTQTRLYTFLPDRGRQSFKFYLGSWTYHDDALDIFAILGEEASYGTVGRCTLIDFGYYGMYSDYGAVFDGMGSVTVSSMGTFSYLPSETENEFEVFYNGTPLFKMLLIELDSDEYGWILYDEELAGEYEAEEGEGTLVLDGYGLSAQLSGRASQWLYAGVSDLMGKTIILTRSDMILLDTEARTYSVAEKRFDEYYWLDAEGGLGDFERYLVLYEDFTAEIYDGDEKCADGTIELNADGAFTFTLNGTDDVIPAQFTFRTDVALDETRLEYLNVYWITEEKDADGTATSHYTLYTEEDGGRLLDYGNGHADYITADGDLYSASSIYIEQELSYFHITYITFNYYDDYGYSRTLYFHVGENNTLKRATSEPTSFVFADEKHERITRGGMLLWIDGIDRARYFGPEAGIGGEAGAYSVYATSTVADDDITVYSFTSDRTDGPSFRFVIVYIDGLRHLLRYNEEKAGEFSSEEGKYLLDGFAFEAMYVAPNGARSLGQYIFLSDDLIRFTDVNTYETRTVKLSLGDRAFVTADDFYGDFFAYVDYEIGEDALRFDGMGHVSFGRFKYDYFGEVTGFNEVASGTYTVLDDDYGILEVHLTHTAGEEENFRVLLMIVDGGYYDYNVFVRAFDEGATYVSDTWEVLMLDGFGFATYIDAEGFVYRDAQYEMSGEDEITFVIDGYARVAKLDGSSFEITDMYFYPVLTGVYGDSSYLTTGEGTVYVRLWQVDEEGTLVAEVTGEMTDGKLLSYDGSPLASLPRLPYTMAYASDNGTVSATIRIEYELDGYLAVIEYRLVSTFLNVFVVRNASYYWTQSCDWQKDGYTVRADRYVRGSEGTGVAGKVMRFALLAGDELLPAGGQDTAGGYVMVPSGEHAGYYAIAFTRDENGIETGVASVTRHDVVTVRGEEYLPDGTALIATAYFASVDGVPCGLQLTYTQSDFGGQIFSLQTIECRKLYGEVYYIYATYTYEDGSGISEFDYVLTLGETPSLEECQAGYVYSENDVYVLYVLISYEGLHAYDFGEFYVHGEQVAIERSERKEDGSGWYLYTGTQKLAVSFRDEGGEIVLVVETVEEERTATAQAVLDGTAYEIVYSLAYGAESPYAILSVSVNGESLPCAMQKKIGSVFRFAVLEGDYAGCYEFTFAGEAGAYTVSAKKYDIQTAEYLYEYELGGYPSSTLFTCYYAMDGETLVDVITATYRVGGSAATVYSFDPYLDLRELGEGRYWLIYAVGSTYYHLVLSAGERELALCYYSYTYDDSGYAFMVLYDMTTGELYGLGDVMAHGTTRTDVLSAEADADGVWTVETSDMRYLVKFTYNAEQQTYSAEVLSSESL